MQSIAEYGEQLAIRRICDVLYALPFAMICSCALYNASILWQPLITPYRFGPSPGRTATNTASGSPTASAKLFVGRLFVRWLFVRWLVSHRFRIIASAKVLTTD